MPSPKPKLTEEEVLEEIGHRDRREYPAMTITELTDRFDVSRSTVQRRVKSLVETGRLRERKHGKVGMYWIDHDESQGVCPDCGGVLGKDEEYEPGYWCRSCGAAFGQIGTADGATAYGKAVERGSKMLVWWASLPSSFKSLVAYMAATFFTDEELPGGDLDDGGYRPERIKLNSGATEQYAGEGEYAHEEEPTPASKQRRP